MVLYLQNGAALNIHPYCQLEVLSGLVAVVGVEHCVDVLGGLCLHLIASQNNCVQPFTQSSGLQLC